MPLVMRRKQLAQIVSQLAETAMQLLKIQLPLATVLQLKRKQLKVLSQLELVRKPVKQMLVVIVLILQQLLRVKQVQTLVWFL